MLGLAALGAEPLLHSPRESSRRGAHVLQPHTKARATRPHLIVTLVDDVGYNDVGWRNGDVKTPFLDSLLRSQSEPTVELLRHYAFSVCSPTRASLLTGRLPAHVNQMNGGADFPATGTVVEIVGKEVDGCDGLEIAPHDTSAGRCATGHSTGPTGPRARPSGRAAGAQDRTCM